MTEAQAPPESWRASTLHCGRFPKHGGLSLCATHPGVGADVARVEAALRLGRPVLEAHFYVSLLPHARLQAPEATRPISASVDPILVCVGSVPAVLGEPRPQHIQDEKTLRPPTGVSPSSTTACGDDRESPIKMSRLPTHRPTDLGTAGGRSNS